MRCLVFGLAVLTTLASAEAQQGGNPAAAAPAAEMSLAVPAPPPAPADPLDAAVLARVEAIRARAAGTTDLAWAERTFGHLDIDR